MITFLYILLAIAVLLVLITVHEFGHYVAGKLLGFKINEFSIGFGPAIFKREKKNGELFAIRALPLGGYCAFEGEDEDGKDNPGAFNTMKPWKRIIVLLAGVTFNLLFGVLFAGIFLMYSGFATVKVTQVVNQANINPINFEQNDVVVSVNGKKVEAYRTFAMMIENFKEGEEFVVTVNRDGEIKDITVEKQKFDAFFYVNNTEAFRGSIFKKDAEQNLYEITPDEFAEDILAINMSGFAPGEDGKYDKTQKTNYIKAYLATVFDENGKSYADDDYEWIYNGSSDASPLITFVGSGVSIGIIQQYVGGRYGFFESLGKAWPYCFYLGDLILNALGGIFNGATALSEMGGTITAVTQIAEVSRMGPAHFLLLIPLLSMNLAIFNVLPIPSLDGARAIFVLIEWIFRKPINRKVENWIHTIGLFVLLGIVIFFDIYHFFIASKLLL